MHYVPELLILLINLISFKVKVFWKEKKKERKKEIVATLQITIQIFGTWLPAFQKGRGWVEDVKVCLGLI